MRGPALALLALAAPAAAQDRVGTLVPIGSRLFLAPDLSAHYRDGRGDAVDFLPLTEIEWISQLVLDDPVLQGVVVHIRRRPTLPAELIGPNGTCASYTETERVPPGLRAPGYVTSAPPSPPASEVPVQLCIRPETDVPDFKLHCGTNYPMGPADELLMCSLMATYPLDPTISVEARLYFPPPVPELAPRLRPMVERLREIALCLDVTEAPPEDPVAALAVLLAENPRLENCGDGLAS